MSKKSTVIACLIAFVVLVLGSMLLTVVQKTESAPVMAPSSPSAESAEEFLGDNRSPVESDSSAIEADSIRLTVRSKTTSLPIRQARVMAAPGPTDWDLLTDVEGIVQVPRWIKERQRVTVTADGYFEACFTSADWTRLTSSQPPHTLDLSPYGSVTVSVTDLQGVPIAGAFVEVLPFDEKSQLPVWNAAGWPVFDRPGFLTPITDPRKKIHGVTDAFGRLNVPYMPVATALVVRAGGKAAETMVRVAIPSDAPDANVFVEIRTETTGTIEGVISDTEGSPISEKWVVITPTVTDYYARVSNTEGRFTFKGVPPGPYSLQCRSPGAEAITVNVAAGQVSSVAIVVPTVVEVSGRIVSKTGLGSVPPGQPGRNINNSNIFVLSRHSRQVVAEATPDPEGLFTLEVPRGPQVLEVRRRGRNAPLRTVHIEAPVSGVEIDLDELMGSIRFELEGAHEKIVRTFMFEASPDEDAPAHHTVRGRTIPAKRALEKTDGTFLYSHVPAGRYDVLVDGGDRGAMWERNVVVTPGTTTELGRQKIGHSRLSGKIVLGHSPSQRSGGVDPLQSADYPTVALVSPTGEQLTATPAADGGFEFGRVKAGPWVLCLQAFGSDSIPAQYCDLFAGDDAHKEIMLDSGMSVIRGVVRADGLPVTGARIHVSPIDRIREVPKLASSLAAASRADGSYEMVVLRGAHVVSAMLEADQSAQVERRHVVVGSEPVIVDFEIDAAQTNVKFYYGDELHEDVDGIVLTSLEGLGARAVNDYRSNGGRVRFFSGRQAVLWTRLAETRLDFSGSRTARSYCAVLDNAPSETDGAITACTDTIEVSIAAGVEVPRLYVDKIEGTGMAHAGIRPEIAWEFVDQDRVRYLSVPRGASVLLGNDISNTLRVISTQISGPLHISWP